MSTMLLWTVAVLFASCVGKKATLNLRVLPRPVFEGDILILQCQARRHTTLSQVKFYKDGKLLQHFELNQQLSMGPATVKSSGQYHCTGQVALPIGTFPQSSAATVIQVQELFQPPVLSAIPSSELSEGSPLTLRCQTKRPSKKLTSKLLFSFHKESYALQRWDHHPEFCIPGVKEADSGLYWCNVILEKGQIQKQSPQLEIKVQAPVSSPSLTLRHRFAGPAAGHMVELLCEARRGSPPILYSFYLNGEILGNRSATHGGAVSLLFPVESAKDTGNYSCEAKNNVSREKSEPKTLSLMGSQVLSTPTSSNWLAVWLPAGLLGVMVTATAFLTFFGPWRKAGPIPAQNIPPAPGGEQWPLHDNVHHQEEKDEDVTYSVVRTTSRKNKARPADFASGEKDISVIYAEVRHPPSVGFPPRS